MPSRPRALCKRPLNRPEHRPAGAHPPTQLNGKDARSGAFFPGSFPLPFHKTGIAAVPPAIQPPRAGLTASGRIFFLRRAHTESLSPKPPTKLPEAGRPCPPCAERRLSLQPPSARFSTLQPTHPVVKPTSLISSSVFVCAPPPRPPSFPACRETWFEPGDPTASARAQLRAAEMRYCDSSVHL